MPSGQRATMLPVLRTTRERLLARKGRATFDAAIVALLDAAPPSLVVDAPPPRRGPPPRAEPRDRRSPEKQLLLRDLAREAWLRREASGELQALGPRCLAWSPRPVPPSKAVKDAIWPDRRGFAP